MMNVIEHYDTLIDENNDTFRDPPPLKKYMDKWDGKQFIDAMNLSEHKKVLEIGVGTGRLAVQVAPYCGRFLGIDISSKTVRRAKENLSEFRNMELVCADFLGYVFEEKFDVIYSSLTLMHFENKQGFMDKVSELLKDGGYFCLSIDKNQSEYIDMGIRKLRIYPDHIENVIKCIDATAMYVRSQFETEFAHVIVCSK